jgi:hypothetical protein
MVITLSDAGEIIFAKRIAELLEKRSIVVNSIEWRNETGPEGELAYQLWVNEVACSTWLPNDCFSFNRLMEDLQEVAQVVEFHLTGTWELHNVVK